MCVEIVRKDPHMVQFLFDCLNTQEICEKAVKMKEYTLCFVSNHLKIQKIDNKAVKNVHGL